ncbi:MAG: phage tail tape measure protein [Intestinibacter bartlettii]
MVKGSKAGMSLKNMLANMAAPTDKMEAALKKLGMTADETGSYLKTTADGNVDLAATCKTLMSAMNGMEKSQKVALLTAIVGKNAAPGILAMLSQGEGAWNELSDSIENSTSTVQFWNENMSIMGKKGNEARKIIDNFKDVYDSVEERATDLGFSTKDLALSIQVLGADGKVTKKNMSDLLDVFESMDSATGKSAVKWRELGGAMKNTKSEIVKNVKSGYDYDSTISKIDSDTSGLTQKQKKQIESQINANMTYKEANKILKKYGLSADHVSLSSLNTSQKLEYLRETTKGLSDDQRKAALKSLGLSDSFDEVTEVCRMSDKDFKKYQKNLETIEGLSSKMAKAMDSDTKGSLLSLASAIEGKAIQVFEKLKGSIKGASNTLAEFFGAWQNQGLEKALLGGYKDSDGGIASGLVKSVQNAAKQIPQAIQNAISSAKGFITGGSMQGILDIGTSIVHGICQGITNSYQSGDLTSAISGFIKNICNWIIDNGGDIKNAVKSIMSSIKDAIQENQGLIQQAVDTLFQIINEYIVGKKDIMWTLGATVGPSFIGGLISGITAEIPKAAEAIGAALGSGIKSIFVGLPSKLLSSFDFDSVMSIWLGKGTKWGIDIGTNLVAGIAEGLGLGSILDAIDNTVRNIINWFKNLFGIHSPSTVMADEVGKFLITGIGQGILDNVGSFFDMLSGLKDKVVNFFKDLFGGKEDTTFKNLDSKEVTKLDKALQNLSKTAQSCKNNLSTAFSGLNSSIRTACISCANITRNQFVNIANIIKNQSQNARNGATSSFISLRKVITTQTSQARQTVTSKMISIANVVNAQSTNARNNATRQFISLRKVIQTQMSQAYSSVSGYMSRIAAATNRTLHTKVNVTKTTTMVTKKAVENAGNAFLSLNSAAVKGQSLGYAMANSNYGLSLDSAESKNNANGKATYFEIVLPLDGKVVAKATAKYMNGELTILDKKDSRKRGRK